MSNFCVPITGCMVQLVTFCFHWLSGTQNTWIYGETASWFRGSSLNNCLYLTFLTDISTKYLGKLYRICQKWITYPSAIYERKCHIRKKPILKMWTDKEIKGRLEDKRRSSRDWSVGWTFRVWLLSEGNSKPEGVTDNFQVRNRGINVTIVNEIEISWKSDIFNVICQVIFFVYDGPFM